MSDCGGGEAVVGYRKLQSHDSQTQCTNLNWILESGNPPSYKGLFFKRTFMYSLDIAAMLNSLGAAMIL